MLSCIAELPLPESAQPSRKAAGDGNKAKRKREHHIAGGTHHFAVAGERQGLKAKGRYRGVGSKDADCRELPWLHGRENPMAGSRCRQHAKQKGPAHIDDYRSPGKCLADAPRNKSGLPEARATAE